MGYLFIEAGLVQLIIEILRFHHEEYVLVCCSLDILCVLLEVPSLLQPVIDIFLKNMDNLVLIVVLMDRYYYDESNDYTVIDDVHVDHGNGYDDSDNDNGNDKDNGNGSSHMESMACIVYMLSLFVKTGTIRDELINTYRVYRFYDVLHFMLQCCSDDYHHEQQHNQQEQQQQKVHHHEYSSELYCRLCLIINNIFYDDRHFRNSLLYTSDYKEDIHEYKKIMQDKIEFKVVIKYIHILFQQFFDNDVICCYGYVALSNLAFNNDQIKKEVYIQHIYKMMITMMKDRMQKIDSYSSTNSIDSTGTSINNNQNHHNYNNHNLNNNDDISSISNSSLILLKDCLYEGLIAACNLIIIPSFLPLDTISTSLNTEMLFHPINSHDENLLLASSVRNDKDNIVYEFIHGGMCELIMNIMTHYLHDRQLVYGALVFIHKMVYRGRYISCYRLVNIRICEQVTFIE